MKLLRHAWVLGVALIGGATFLYAQPAPEGNDGTEDAAPADPADLNNPATGTATGTVSGTIDPANPGAGAATATARMSFSEMGAGLNDMRKKVREDNRYTLYLRETARKQKDVIKLNCVNDKLIQIKAQTNIFDAHASELELSLSAQSDSRFGMYTDANFAAEGIHKLREEAGLCVGEVELGSQENPPAFTGPDIIQPSGDPFSEGVEPPVYASPYK